MRAFVDERITDRRVRPLRIEFPGAVYHLTSRGHARQNSYRDHEDREAFLTTLAQVVEICHAHCLMDIHFHVLMETWCAHARRARGREESLGCVTGLP
jgi:putative transposase